METRANYALIGAFTLAAIAAMFGFATWFAGVSGKGNRVDYRIVFSGSVSGLSRGASVLFNGLRVGEVSTISLLPEDPRRVVAVIEIDPLTPMRSDTRARLEFQGLTGVAAIQLSGGEPGSQPLQAGANREPPTIFADRSDFQDIVETVQRLSRRVDDVINRAEKLLADNEGSVGRTVRNVETFTQALAVNSDGIGRFLEATTSAGERIASLSTKLEGMTTDLDGVIKAIEPQRVSRIIANVEAFSDAIGANRDRIEALVGDAAAFMRRINETAGRVDGLIADASGILRRVDLDQVEALVRDAAAFARRINETTGRLDSLIADASGVLRGVDPAVVSRTLGNIDRVTATISANNEQIDSIVKDAAAFARRANDTAGRLDVLISDASGILRGVDPTQIETLVRDAAAFARRINETTGRLDGLIADASGVLRGVDPAVVSRMLGNIDRVTATIGANNEQIDSFVKDAAAFARRITDTTGKLDVLISDAGSVLRGVDPALLSRTLGNIDRVAATISANNGEIDRALKDFSDLGARLSEASKRVDGVLLAVERFFGTGPEGEAKGMMADIAAAARSFRTLSDNLDKRTADITVGFRRLTGPGLRDLEALTTDGRRTLNDLSRTVRSIERNPSQVIFGGQSSLPEYQGRR